MAIQLPKIQHAATEGGDRLSKDFYNAINQALSTLNSQVTALEDVTGAVTDPATGDIADVAAQLAALNLAVGSLKYLATSGIVVKGGSVYSTRTLQDTATIGWTNPDGVAGDPSADFIGTTDDVPEGATNLYFTEPRVLATVLAGLDTSSSTPITASDSVLSAFGSLQAQITGAISGSPNLDGGNATSVYGGIPAIDGGSA